MDRLAAKLPVFEWPDATKVQIATIIGQDIVVDDIKTVVSKYEGSLSVLFHNPTTNERASFLTSSEVLVEKLKYAKEQNLLPALVKIVKVDKYYTIE